MKKNILCLMIICLIFLVSCTATTPTPNNKTNTSEELDKQLAISYYRGVYNTCIYAAKNDKQSNPEEFCLYNLEFALEHDWYNLTDWPTMPDLTPLDNNTPVPTKDSQG